MKKKIALVGAFDRDNYGDILMPIIFTKYFSNNYDEFSNQYKFEYFGLQESNLKELGGNKTKSIAQLFGNLKEYDSIVLVGGDILPSRYGNMFLNLQHNSKKIKLYKFFDIFLRPLFDYYCKKKLSAKTVRPWIIDEEYAKNIKVIYNTVGGLLINRKLLINGKKVVKALQNASYLSVRDNKTKFYLDKNHINNKLFPDSVILLSEVIDDESINKNISTEVKQKVNSFGDYIVVQMNEKVGSNIIDEVAKEIEKIYNTYQVSCILLPIGKAQGHEDQIPLTLLKDKVKTNIYMPTFNNIYDTAYIIKNSKFYVGTSLHGVITSITYEVPHTALTNHIGKLNRFIETWDTTSIYNTKEDEIFTCYKYFIDHEKTTKQALIEKRKELINLAKVNFDNIYLNITE